MAWSRSGNQTILYLLLPTNEYFIQLLFATKVACAKSGGASKISQEGLLQG